MCEEPSDVSDDDNSGISCFSDDISLHDLINPVASSSFILDKTQDCDNNVNIDGGNSENSVISDKTELNSQNSNATQESTANTGIFLFSTSILIASFSKFSFHNFFISGHFDLVFRNEMMDYFTKLITQSEERINEKIRRSQAAITFEMKKGYNSVKNTLKFHYGLQNLEKYNNVDDANLGMALPVDSTEDFQRLDDELKNGERKELFVS